MDAFDSTWISSRGKYLEEFEQSLEGFSNRPCSLVANGTVALHLLLLSNGISPGDEIIISNLTYVATMNSILYCGAIPRFADIEAESWNIDPLSAEKLINSKTKAILLTHLYGQPVNIEAFQELKRKHGLLILEDAAEAMGATYKQDKVGSIFDGGVFSFFGNKSISTGEGGLVISASYENDQTVKILRNQGNHKSEKFNHTHLGFNYRMTNLQAAIGLAQLESLTSILKERQDIFTKYGEMLKGIPVESQKNLPEQATHGYWMYGLCVPEKYGYEQVAEKFEKQNIETRPFFKPMSGLPYVKNTYSDETPIAERVSRSGICLPTFVGINEEQLQRIVKVLEDFDF
jgi:perosamine synthetase